LAEGFVLLEESFRCDGVHIVWYSADQPLA
jgi:hypothetical protein